MPARRPIPTRGEALQSWRRLASVFCLLAMALAAHGHGHNLSTGTLKFLPDRLEARVTFAQNELRAILPLDQNGDGVVSPEELAAEQQHLDALALHLFEVMADARPVQLQSARAVIATENDIYFDLAFQLPAASQVVLHSLIVRKMPDVHRQFLTVVDSEAKPLTALYLTPTADTLVAAGGKFYAQASAPAASPAAVAHEDSGGSSGRCNEKEPGTLGQAIRADSLSGRAKAAETSHPRPLPPVRRSRWSWVPAAFLALASVAVAGWFSARKKPGGHQDGSP